MAYCLSCTATIRNFALIAEGNVLDPHSLFKIQTPNFYYCNIVSMLLLLTMMMMMAFFRLSQLLGAIWYHLVVRQRIEKNENQN